MKFDVENLKEALTSQLAEINAQKGQKTGQIINFINVAIYKPVCKESQPNIQVYLALEKRENWPSGYYANSTHVTFSVYTDGKIEARMYGAVPVNVPFEEKENSVYRYCAQKGLNKIYRSFPKQTFSDAKNVAEKMLNYFYDAIAAANEYTLKTV